MHQFGAGTNVGNVRDNNEDSYVCDDDKELWVVADGMGGLGFGEVASAITTYTVTTHIREGHGVNQAIELAHKRIKEYAESDGLGTNMGTTIVLLLSHGSLYNVFWVGDSRAYLLEENSMKQITIDHSLVQTLIDQGELTREEATTDPRKNAVTRALGVQELETVRADSVSERWSPGQKILLCSDGLTDCVSDKDIETLVRKGGTDQEIVDRLIEAALEGGGKDNVTIIVVSAPSSVKAADTDTHVPEGTGQDDTWLPSDDTQRPKNGDKETSQAQLSLEISPKANEQLTEDVPQQQSLLILDTSRSADAETADPEPEEKASGWKTTGATAAAAFFLLIALTLQFEQPTAGVPDNFKVVDDTPARPIERIFPAFDYPDSGAVLQLGVYSQLSGAETHQTSLARLGLAPHIEKRVAGQAIMYAVMIGPLDIEEHAQVKHTLEENNLSYFHKRNSGS